MAKQSRIQKLIEEQAQVLNKLESHMGCVLCAEKLQDGQCLTATCSAYNPAFVLTHDEVSEAISKALALVGLTDYADLQAQAEAGSFDSEQAKRVWFATHAFKEELNGISETDS